MTHHLEEHVSLNSSQNSDLLTEKKREEKREKHELKIQKANNFLNILSWIFNTNIEPVEEIESKIFACLSNKFHREYVYIKNDTLKIWTATANIDSKKTPIVLVHGFCGSIGLWAHNIDKLSESHPVYAFDLLGFGRSSRPDFTNDPVIAENEFVESIEEWRKALGIEKMILMGHSFGGFLSTAYSLKYPERIKALILADPWGFPIQKQNGNQESALSRLTNFKNYLSPYSMMRVIGIFGLKIFKRTKPDFKKKFISILGDNDILYDYLYHCNSQKPSGEQGFRYISNGINYARNPMMERIHELDQNMPIWFIYGKKTWIEKMGYRVKEIRDEYSFVSVSEIDGAGHHLYCDQPEIFNKHFIDILSTIESKLETED